MYKLGIDVGGTNTDAVLVDENRAVVADIKYPTSADIYDGILGAMRTVLEVSGVDPAQIHQAMLGTTQCTNAIVERKNLAPIGILRIGAPATTGIRPMVDWSEDIQKVAVGSTIIGGGFEYDGRELAPLDPSSLSRSAEGCTLIGQKLNRHGIRVYTPQGKIQLAPPHAFFYSRCHKEGENDFGPGK